MEKQKRWQLYLILAVIILTLYNILPTIFYYSKPLKDPITATHAESVAAEIADRANVLEEDAVDWIYSFSKLLSVKPLAVATSPTNPQVIEVKFKGPQEAVRFKKFLPHAGALIPFLPSQLEVAAGPENDPNTVHVLRKIGVRLDPAELSRYFQYIPKVNEQGQIADEYKQLVYDRVSTLALAYGGPSLSATQIAYVLQPNAPAEAKNSVLSSIAADIVDMQKSFGVNSPVAKRYFASFSQGNFEKTGFVQKLIAQMEMSKAAVDKQLDALVIAQKKEGAEVQRDSSEQQSLAALEGQKQLLSSAISILKSASASFEAGKAPLTAAMLQKELQAKGGDTSQQTVSLQGRNPYVEALVIDWTSDQIILKLYDDIRALQKTEVASEASAFTKEKINQYVINEIAHGARGSDESIVPFWTILPFR